MSDYRQDASDLDPFIKNLAQNWKGSGVFQMLRFLLVPTSTLACWTELGRKFLKICHIRKKAPETSLLSALLLENPELFDRNLEQEWSHTSKNTLEHINTPRRQSPFWRSIPRAFSTCRFQRGGSRSTFLHGLHWGWNICQFPLLGMGN